MSITRPFEFSHGSLRIEFDPELGSWTALSFRGDNLMIRGSRSAFRLRIDGIDISDWRLVNHNMIKQAGGIEVVLEYASDTAIGMRAWQIFDLFGDAGRIERWLHVAAMPGVSRHVQGAALRIEGLTAGSPDNTNVSVVNAPTSPNVPLKEFAASANEQTDYGEGPLILSRIEPPLHIWMLPTSDETSRRLKVMRHSDAVSGSFIAEHEFEFDAMVGADETVTAAEHMILIQNREWRTALAHAGKHLGQRGIEPAAWRGDVLSEWVIQGLADGLVDGAAIARLIGEYVLSLPPLTTLSVEIPHSLSQAESNPGLALAATLAIINGVTSSHLKFPSGFSRQLFVAEHRSKGSFIVTNFSNVTQELAPMHEEETRHAPAALFRGRIAPWDTQVLGEGFDGH